MAVTTDPNHPQLTHVIDIAPMPQAKVYLVLPEQDRAKGFVRPNRTSYRHEACATVTSMGAPIAETYARDPTFYGATYCVSCRRHRPVGEFRWLDGEVLGS